MINSGPVEVQEPKFAIRELDHRRSDGIEVTLLWNNRTDEVFVAVAERDGGRFEFTVGERRLQSKVARALVGGRFARMFERSPATALPSEAISSGERAGLYQHER